MKKIIMLLIAAILILAGCSSSSETSEGGVVELTMSTWAGGEELEQMQAIVDTVNAEHAEEYHITLQSIPSDYYVKLQTQASANQLPDIMWMSQEQVAPFAAAGALMPITEMSEQFYTDYPMSEEMVKSASYNGEVYGLPWIANPIILYYNKDIVDDADEAVLEATNTGDYMTWEEFNTMAAKYHDEANGKYGTLIGGWPPLEFFMWTMGGEVQDAEGNIMINSPESVAGIQLLIDMVITNPITPDQATIDQLGATGTFQQGNTAFMFGGASDGVELVDGNAVPFEVGYAVVPMGTTAATYNWTASTVISSSCENPEVAYAAVEDLTLAFWEWKVVPPVSDITTLGYESYEDYLTQFAPAKVGMATTIEESLKIAKTDNYTADSSVIYGAMWDEIYSVILSTRVNGGETPDAQTLADNAMAKIEESLN